MFLVVITILFTASMDILLHKKIIVNFSFKLYSKNSDYKFIKILKKNNKCLTFSLETENFSVISKVLEFVQQTSKFFLTKFLF